MKPFGDGFVKPWIKMAIAPIIFCTVVTGIAGHAEHEVGRQDRRHGAAVLRGRLHRGLIIGLVVVDDVPARRRHDVDPNTLDTSRSLPTPLPAKQGHRRLPDERVPGTVVARSPTATSSGSCSSPCFFGYALHRLGSYGKPEIRVHRARLPTVMFNIINVIMKVAPIGAFGAMAYHRSLRRGFAGAARPADAVLPHHLHPVRAHRPPAASPAPHGFSILRFIRYIRRGTADRAGHLVFESALPRMIDKMEARLQQVGSRPG